MVLWRWALRSRRLYRLLARNAGSPWPGRAHDRRLPALRAAARRGGADGGRPRPAAPASMTLMGGPVDTRRSPTGSTSWRKSAASNGFAATACIQSLSPIPASAGRSIQAFCSSRLHGDEHRPPYGRARQDVPASGAGDEDSTRHREFYDEYLSAMDLTAESTCKRSRPCSCATPCPRAR